MKLKHFFVTLILLITGTLIGITGSNIGVANDWQVINVEQKILFGRYRGMRSDEWAVLTTLCLSQMNHKPSFPVHNNTIDVSGKNMLIVHDLGVPVWHPSALARPATWGFFTGNVRFGLSWYWLCPVFIGFVGIALLFNEFFGAFKINMFLALGIVYAPICAAWSNFPLYELGFGALSTWSFIRLLQEEKLKKCLLYSLLTGWSAASFALTLYLPRLVPMTWLFLFCAALLIIDKHLFNNLAKRLPYLGLASLVTVLFIGVWYIDAKDGIAAMLNSAYPGNRIHCGGSFTLFDLVRGWFARQLVLKDAGFSNQCELSSFPNTVFMLLPMMGLYFKSFTGNKKVVFGLAFLLACLYGYQFAGYPDWLAKLSFMGKSLPPRVDSSIMLCQLILLVYFVKHNSIKESSLRKRSALIIISTVLFAGTVVSALNYCVPPEVKVYLLQTNWKFMLLTAVLWLCLVLSVNFSPKALCCALAVVYIVPGAGFNNISVAPKEIKSLLPAYITADRGTAKSRLLFVTGSPWEANTANALGVASFDGVHHYADRYVYEKFYKNYENGEQFNRFNHTMFTFDGRVTGYKLEIPQGDVIRWTIGNDFDFARLPIEYVAVNIKTKNELQNNKSVEYLEDKGRFAFYKVKRND